MTLLLYNALNKKIFKKYEEKSSKLSFTFCRRSSAGKSGKIDLLVKLPNGKGMIFECKFCEKWEEIEGKKEKAKTFCKT